jgi:protein TonB
MQKEKTSRPDMVDILFEHRNKEYGAYAIRRAYPGHLLRGLVVGVALITSGAWLMARPQERWIAPMEKPRIDTVTLIPPPTTQMEILLPPPAVPHTATVPFTIPNVVPNDMPITDTVATQTDLNPVDAGVHDQSGPEPASNRQPASSTLPPAPEATPDKTVYESSEVDEPAEFPGGPAALGHFLHHRLQDPREDGDEGGRVNVKVLFVVGSNGELGNYRILDGGEDRFGAEVVRVLCKMPRWKPARQRNRPVAMHFILPVTFAPDGD